MGELSEMKDEVSALVKLIQAQETAKNTKKFRLPFGKKVGKAQKKKNYVTAVILNENGNVQFTKYKIEDQTIVHDLIPRLATSGHVMYYKGNPMLFLPNWSVKPISPLDSTDEQLLKPISSIENLKESLTDGSNVIGYKILMAKMVQGAVNAKPKIGGIVKWIVGFGLIAIIGYAFMTGGG